MSELGGEKIDIIEWSDDPEKFVEDALSPARILSVDIDGENQTARVEVSPDQQSLAIGRGGQNVRLAAKLTGWKIDIRSLQSESVADDEHVEINEDMHKDKEKGEESEKEVVEVKKAEVPEKKTKKN